MAYFQGAQTGEKKKIKGKRERENCPHACLNVFEKQLKTKMSAAAGAISFFSTSRALKTTVTILLLRKDTI